MWKTLLQMRVLLPYAAKLMPLIEANSAAALSRLVKPDLSEVHQGFDELQSDNRELGMQVQDQMVHLKRIEEQMTRVRESNERISTEHLALMADLRSMESTVKLLFACTLGLLTVLVVLLSFVLAHLAR